MTTEQLAEDLANLGPSGWPPNRNRMAKDAHGGGTLKGERRLCKKREKNWTRLDKPIPRGRDSPKYRMSHSPAPNNSTAGDSTKGEILKMERP